MVKRIKSKAWFTKVRGSYLPANSTGLLVYTLYLLFLAAIIAVWCVAGHEILWLIIAVIPLSLIAVAVTQSIASKHSK